MKVLIFESGRNDADMLKCFQMSHCHLWVWTT